MSDAASPVQLIASDAVEGALGALPPAQAAWARTLGFAGKLGQIAPLPDAEGELSRVLFGWGDPGARARGRFHLGRLPAALPDGRYRLETAMSPDAAMEAALGWELGRTRFDRYKSAPEPQALLETPAGVDPARLAALVAGARLTRRLIDTPAEEMGPAEIEAAIRAMAAEHGAEASSIVGDDLLGEKLNLIHAVGRAAGPGRAPRLIDLRWGPEDAPKVTLVGKGVAFDTGGLGIKPSGSMGLMKKDMGGAANAIGLALMIMTLKLPVRLRLLVPSVENSISGPAFRPGDVFRSRAGLTVEVNHTDAEGRLVLADAMAVGAEEAPRFMTTIATLTGAARVALGPDLPPYFTDDEEVADALEQGARKLADPLWRMPFWEPYEEMIEPQIADLDNAPGGGMAGAITAALFLRRFSGAAQSYAHFDIYGWTPSPKPGRPKGGEMQAARALLHAIETRFA